MGRGNSKGLTRDKYTRLAIDEMEGKPFTVTDLLMQMKTWNKRNLPTTREIGMVLAKMLRIGELKSLGEEAPLVFREMTEVAGLYQGQGRKTTLYVDIRGVVDE